MKTKNYLLIFGIIVLLSINLMNLFRIQSLKSHTNFLSKRCYDNFISDSVIISTLSSNLKFLSQNSGFKISPDLILPIEDGKEIKLSDLCTGKHRLVFRYNEFTCQDCIHKEMGNIKAISEKIGANNVLVLASYENQHDFYINKRVNNIDLPIYNIPLKSFDNTIENYNIPYIFILGDKGEVKNLFIPNKYLPSLTEEYFLDIMKYFKNPDCGDL